MKELELRLALKKRKPKFSRQDAHKKPKLSYKWRKPKGTDSKMRLHKRGYKGSPSKGYKSPKVVRGLTRSGLKPIPVANVKELQTVDVKTQTALISGKVGGKKLLSLLQIAKEKNIPVVNYKDITTKMSAIESKLKASQAAKKKKADSKKKKEDTKKKDAKKAEKKEELSEEEKKVKEKKDLDKLLNQKGSELQQ